MVKEYNFNHYGHYSSGCPNRALEEGEAHISCGANDTIADNNDNNDTPGGGKANIMLAVMDLDNYEPSYNVYDFLQPAAIANDTTSSINVPIKTYL